MSKSVLSCQNYYRALSKLPETQLRFFNSPHSNFFLAQIPDLQKFIRPKMINKDILIVGCGVAGPVLATWLLKSSPEYNITIVERGKSTESYGQNIDIRGAGATIIRKMGLDTAVRAHITGEEGARFVDENDRVAAEFPADKTGKVQTGTSDLEILRGRLASLCFGRCKSYSAELQQTNQSSGVNFIFNETLSNITQDESKVHVKFSNSGEERSYDLLVGADGILSTTRKMVFGAENDVERVHQTGMYGAFFSMPHGGNDSLWRRWFHAPGRRGIMIRPGETPERSTVFMYVVSDDDKRYPEAARLGHKGVEKQKALLEDLFKDAGWECDRVISEMHDAKDFYYNMVAQIKMPHWTNGRVALLGDAGYCPSPISGMGTTLAITGAYNLAGALRANPASHSDAFAAYETTIRPNVEKAQKLLPGFPHIFNPETETGIHVMESILGFMDGAQKLGQKLGRGLFYFGGPPANEVPVEDYGLGDLEEWNEASSSGGREVKAELNVVSETAASHSTAAPPAVQPVQAAA
ncbi:FAD/NAD(P)-binding domain-containing protein [Dissoconium aciculare CBS 342.82]|uniref:FAD/NAD(P)-binding domain-containing protein n=1 Tax=Dissoconium aciculare CBS 342.82 TaxID=1314786 RepID=A0A6J3M1C6_9PEZI|nr:FAD/NAD(P)-binding domain-containing protein [Dissoconium aciculare CBS 342.82]KAF1821304.1 FAD/NAD(P)-binding domain-containing protein [Dissoconium aciculare CBS 342.82]